MRSPARSSSPIRAASPPTSNGGTWQSVTPPRREISPPPDRRTALQPTREWLNRPGGLAERLQRMRKAAGLTGDQLAVRLGWTRAKVPKIENGRQMPTEADIKAWAEAT